MENPYLQVSKKEEVKKPEVKKGLPPPIKVAIQPLEAPVEDLDMSFNEE
jgi:hypothetical protein